MPLAGSVLKQSVPFSSTRSSSIEFSDSFVRKIYAGLIPGRDTLSEDDVLRTAGKSQNYL